MSLSCCTWPYLIAGVVGVILVSLVASKVIDVVIFFCVLGSLAIVGVGLYYFYCKNDSSGKSSKLTTASNNFNYQKIESGENDDELHGTGE